MVARVVRVERNREQALLAAALDEGVDVEERLRLDLAVDEHANHARLLDHVELARLAARRRHVERRIQSGRDHA